MPVLFASKSDSCAPHVEMACWGILSFQVLGPGVRQSSFLSPPRGRSDTKKKALEKPKKKVLSLSFSHDLQIFFSVLAESQGRRRDSHMHGRSKKGRRKHEFTRKTLPSAEMAFSSAADILLLVGRIRAREGSRNSLVVDADPISF